MDFNFQDQYKPKIPKKKGMRKNYNKGGANQNKPKELNHSLYIQMMHKLYDQMRHDCYQNIQRMVTVKQKMIKDNPQKF